MVVHFFLLISRKLHHPACWFVSKAHGRKLWTLASFAPVAKVIWASRSLGPTPDMEVSMPVNEAVGSARGAGEVAGLDVNSTF